MNTLSANDQWMPALVVKPEGYQTLKDWVAPMRHNHFSNSHPRSALFIYLTAFITVLTLFHATGQSCFEMSNLISPLVNAPVYDALGTPLAGGNYVAELWGGATVNSLTPLRPYSSDTRYIIPFVERGYFVGEGVRN